MQLIYLMRHGQSVVNVAHRLSCNNFEGDLTDLGREQASKAAEWLVDKDISLIRHSPFHRAEQTAQLVGEKLGLPIAMDDGLREINCGDLHGRGDDEAWEYFMSIFMRWKKQEWEARFPGGETFRQGFERFSTSLRNIPDHQTVLLVAHGGIIETVVPYLCVNAAALQGQRGVGNTGIVILEPYGDGRFICRAWDSQEHL